MNGRGDLLTCPKCGKKSYVSREQRAIALENYSPESGSPFYCPHTNCHARLSWPIAIIYRVPEWTEKDEQMLQALAVAALKKMSEER